MKWREGGSVSLKGGKEEGKRAQRREKAEGRRGGNRRRVVEKGSKIFEENLDNHRYTV